MSENRLKFEKSPYLLQHKDNPVHWQAWGEEAFQIARKENKPIFLSIGYSTCHWCHVMEHESFEKPEVADVLNRDFISIKVDREERPDVDDIYMSAVHAMRQRGGWPLNLFLTPDLKPFFGGTYWPKAPFMQLVEHLAKLWKEEPQKIQESGDSILEYLRAQKSFLPEFAELDEKVFSRFYSNSLVNFDRRWGGFGPAPKFPHAMQLSMLLRVHRRTQDPQALQMVVHTLEQMARGGIYDHLGYGFARYSTDEKWLVPHFEKMLYDNALLAIAYLEAFQITKIELFESVAREILDYVLRAMTHPEGGFYSAEDADSEGEEGKFCVWTYEELKKILSQEEFELFCKVYQVTPSGNFEHETNILSLSFEYGWFVKEDPLLKSAHTKLFKIREARIHPHKDDKILTAWNGLMIRAMALGYQVLRERRFLDAAHRAVTFLKKNLFQKKQLLARYRDGEGRFAARLEDSAYLIQSLIDLYQCDFKTEILEWALELQELQNQNFWDQEGSAYFFTDGKDPSLLVRSKEGTDGALPNANAVSALNLLRLYDLTFKQDYREKALKIFQCFAKMISEYPHAFSQMLIAYDYFHEGAKEIAVIASSQDSLAEKFLQELRSLFLPNQVTALSHGVQTFPSLLDEKKLIDGQSTFYICQNQTCQSPTHDVVKALEEIQNIQRYAL